LQVDIINFFAHSTLTVADCENRGDRLSIVTSSTIHNCVQQ